MEHHVLFVDDEPHITDGLKRALRAEPYTILTASSPADGMQILSEHPVDVVVSDEKMPEMSGSEFLSVVCENYPDTVRMMLTGHATLEDTIRAINEGQIYHFFKKPCDTIELASTIRHALQQKELSTQSRRLLKTAKCQSSLLQELEKQNPGITQLSRDEDGAILLETAEKDLGDVLSQIENELAECEKMLEDYA